MGATKQKARRFIPFLVVFGITRCSGSGVSAIAKTYNSLSRLGGSLKLLCPPGHVRSVLKIVRLLDLIPTFEDEAQALASFQEIHRRPRPETELVTPGPRLLHRSPCTDLCVDGGTKIGI
jgi:hypothetical protein